jgi:hypothetical protein
MYYISSNADRSDAFCLLYINQLPVVECTQNLLYIIQRRLTRRAFSFVIYHSTACSGVDVSF